MNRSKNSEGIRDEFVASKKHGKKKIVLKVKKVVKKKNANKTLAFAKQGIQDNHSFLNYV